VPISAKPRHAAEYYRCRIVRHGVVRANYHRSSRAARTESILFAAISPKLELEMSSDAGAQRWKLGLTPRTFPNQGSSSLDTKVHRRLLRMQRVLCIHGELNGIFARIQPVRSNRNLQGAHTSTTRSARTRRHPRPRLARIPIIFGVPAIGITGIPGSAMIAERRPISRANGFSGSTTVR